MSNKDILFICDFETTGVNIDKDYPIELGGIFVDSDLNILNTLNMLIKYPRELIYDEENIKYGYWKQEYIPAYKVHNISCAELLSHGYVVGDVVDRLLYTMSNIKNTHNISKIIITSDNAQFEYNFMKKLFKLADMESKWPFHYCAWDTSLCLELFAPDIGDAIPVHRALPDALRLYKQLVRYAEKVGYWKTRNGGHYD